ncbi:hypothetical protein RI129_001324 [Pyrocoelia pectoralis]|uniref:NADP-dependent oxidoreductase domain-containing protein n=1 Tax=Pyrocoelia pectoralis TaxID=417401 RepID=A0AAN7VMP7_9COLE
MAATIKLKNGLEMPVFGLGTWNAHSDEITKAIEHAIDVGYRHFDCAFAYGNEKEIGIGIANKINEGKIKREDIFVTNKLWNTFHSPHLVEGALKQSLQNFGFSYFDLYLMHWPVAFKEGKELFPAGPDGAMQCSNVNFLDTWKAMEKLVGQGLVKSIGISNFNKRQIETLLNVATIRPVMNQIECHPYLNQKDLIEFCKSKGIAITAYCPLGSPDRSWAKVDDPKLFEEPILKELAKKHGKTIAQVALKYNVQRGCVTIPKSSKKSRIEENFDIFDFELSADDIACIDTLDCNLRVCALPRCSHPENPF